MFTWSSHAPSFTPQANEPPLTISELPFAALLSEGRFREMKVKDSVGAEEGQGVTPVGVSSCLPEEGDIGRIGGVGKAGGLEECCVLTPSK